MISREKLLADYAERASIRGFALEASALRSESLEMREILAYLASHGRWSRREVEQAVLQGNLSDCNAEWLAKLARVSALQNFLPTDIPFARTALSFANPRLPASAASPRRFRKLEVELAYADGDFEAAKRLLDADPDLRRVYYNYLNVDLHNPYTGSPFAEHELWITGLNAPLRAHKIEPVELTPDPGRPFDRLRSPQVSRKSVEGPLVTVVMTTYKPDRAALLTSLQSIIDQSWSNLQIVVVDDASGPEYAELLTTLESIDSRIETVRLPVNGGTYLARNAGIAAAHGEFICGQDADDWSHPRRIEVQVRALLANDDTPAVRVAGINTSEQLVRTRVGYNPASPNASSLMYRARLARELGGYAPARKAADNEFHQRLEKYTRQDVTDLKAPLSFIRILPQSLSRSDFRAGWSHPARRAFKSAYAHWHGDASHDALVLDNQQPSPPFPIPHRFRLASGQPDDLDIVYAGDWRQYGGPQKSMIEEITAAFDSGYRVGILHLEAARFLSTTTKPLCAPVQELINAGSVTHVLQDDEIDVDLVILRYPPILQFPPYQPFAIRAKKLIILANQAPSERDGSDIRYLVDDCSMHAERLFGVRGLWVPQGPTVRATLENTVPKHELAPFDMPGILNPSDWATSRSHFRSTVPVVGRHSRDNPMKWPENASSMRALYPTDGSVDIRVMGGGKTPAAVLGISELPASWVVFDTDELPVRTFLNSIDFFVYFQHSNAYDAFGRAILEAIAAGCVAVLPHHLEPTFGDAAVYCEVEDVNETIWELYSNVDLYRSHLAQAAAVVESRFGHGAYARLLASVLEAGSSGSPAPAETFSRRALGQKPLRF